MKIQLTRTIGLVFVNDILFKAPTIAIGKGIGELVRQYYKGNFKQAQGNPERLKAIQVDAEQIKSYLRVVR